MSMLEKRWRTKYIEELGYCSFRIDEYLSMFRHADSRNYIDRSLERFFG